MRILSIGAALGRGGTERALETFSLGYHRLGHSVAVLAWQEGGPRRTTLEREGIEVFVGGAQLQRAIQAADAFNPDLLHIHRVGVASAIELAILRSLRTHGRRVLETNVFSRVDTSEASNYVDVHMHLSKWCLWRWGRSLGWRRPLQIGVVVPNPIDRESFRPLDANRREEFRSQLGIDGNTFVCGRVGQPNAANWHPALFTAFLSLARVASNVRLLLLGLPDSLRPNLEALHPDLKRLVIELPLTDGDDKLTEVYSSLDCFLHAARFGESFGYVLTESMLCECPVVTASTPQMSNSQVEVVGHLTGGLVAGSLDSLTAGLWRMYSDSDLRSTLRPKLREHVLSRFDVEAVAVLAAQIGTVALEEGDRNALRRRLAETPGCILEIDDEEITQLMTHTLGGPRVRDLLEMRVRHHPLVQRVIDARLTRRMNRSTVREMASAAVRLMTLREDAWPTLVPPQRKVTVSAIMPTYNMARHIREAVESVLAQTMADWELVIVDDGSTDDTQAVLARYTDARIRVVRTEKNGGRPVARNLALQHANGRYIAICDSDDTSVPTRFAKQVAFLEAHPEVDVVSGQIAHFSAEATPRVIVRFPETAPEIRERLARGKMGLAHGASMLRFECFRDHGGYCPDLRSAEDLEFFRRIADQCTFASLPDVLVAYRHDLPDPFSKWMASARYQRYALYRSDYSAFRDTGPLAYGEFSSRWRTVVLNHTVDLARFAVWVARSRGGQRLSGPS